MFCSGEGSELPDSEFPVNSDLLTNRCSRPGAAHSGCFRAYSAGSRDSLSAAGGAVFVRGKFRVTESPTTRLMVPEIRVKSRPLNLQNVFLPCHQKNIFS